MIAEVMTPLPSIPKKQNIPLLVVEVPYIIIASLNQL
tara:strand:- start:135 stop:245 length:111 start_codon:yes stop_codon:yes gene_type:complete